MNRFAEAVQQSRVDVVPRVVVSGGGGEGGGASGSSIMEGLLTLLLSDKLNLEVNSSSTRERSPEVERLRNEIRQSMSDKPDDASKTPPAAPTSPATPMAPTKK